MIHYYWRRQERMDPEKRWEDNTYNDNGMSRPRTQVWLQSLVNASIFGKALILVQNVRGFYEGKLRLVWRFGSSQLESTTRLHPSISLTNTNDYNPWMMKEWWHPIPSTMAFWNRITLWDQSKVLLSLSKHLPCVYFKDNGVCFVPKTAQFLWFLSRRRDNCRLTHALFRMMDWNKTSVESTSDWVLREVGRLSRVSHQPALSRSTHS